MNPILVAAPRRAATIADNLAAFGLDVPKTLAQALAVHAELTEAPPTPEPPHALVSEVTPAQARKNIDEWLNATARLELHKAHAGAVFDATSRALLRAIRSTRGDILVACREPFAEHAAEFTEHFRELPGTWSNPEALLRAGSTAVSHYERAVTAAGPLDQLAEIRAGVVDDGPTGYVALATEYADWPEGVDVEAYGQRIQTESQTPLGRWGAILAQHPQAALAWRTPAEHQAAIESVAKWATRYEAANWGDLKATKPSRQAILA